MVHTVVLARDDAAAPVSRSQWPEHGKEICNTDARAT